MVYYWNRQTKKGYVHQTNACTNMWLTRTINMPNGCYHHHHHWHIQSAYSLLAAIQNTRDSLTRTPRLPNARQKGLYARMQSSAQHPDVSQPAIYTFTVRSRVLSAYACTLGHGFWFTIFDRETERISSRLAVTLAYQWIEMERAMSFSITCTECGVVHRDRMRRLVCTVEYNSPVSDHVRYVSSCACKSASCAVPACSVHIRANVGSYVHTYVNRVWRMCTLCACGSSAVCYSSVFAFSLSHARVK